MSSIKQCVQIADRIYWVGFHDDSDVLQCNPYLLVDDDEAVLFDPGSVLDFQYVYENIKRIIPIEKIKYVVLHHQDPDFCSSVPLFEKEGAKFTIVTHWRAQSIIKFYGIKSDYYLVDENNFSLKLNSGREILFVSTPYLHFPGAFASYDVTTKTLFSSDLFGAMSSSWDLIAGNDYIEKMKTFHEHYMPSNEILRPVMETLLLMDIQTIAPQHGSIITQEVQQHIKALRDLECGTFLHTVKKNLKKAGGYAGICGNVIRRYISLYPREDVLEALEGLDIELDAFTYEIKDYNYAGLDLWEKLFENIYFKKGIKWLLMIEPLALKLSKEYDLPVPRIFKSEIKSAQQESLLLKEEVLELRKINERLNRNIEETQGKITTCPVTGLYNEAFFMEYIKTEITSDFSGETYENKSLSIFCIDNMARIEFLYGDTEADNIINGLVYLLKEIKAENYLLFRLQGPVIACFMPNTSKDEAVRFSERFRNEIRTSNKFIEELTVSAGVTCLREHISKGSEAEELPLQFYRIAMTRLRLAKGKGGNLVCSQSDVSASEPPLSKILICDSDCANRDVLKSFLENLNYSVIAAADGEAALELAEMETPNLVVSEILLPKIDGFILCEKLKLQSSTKDIPFIITSNLKNEDSVRRAISLGIENYFMKPYMLSELLGIIKLKVKGAGFFEG